MPRYRPPTITTEKVADIDQGETYCADKFPESDRVSAAITVYSIAYRYKKELVQDACVDDEEN